MNEHSNSADGSSHAMACMEIWGGNRGTYRTVNLPGLDVWVYSKPYQQAESGGDVYYVSSCATGRITRLMLADVSGHGSAVAEIANNLRLLMRRYINHIRQLTFVTRMNDAFAKLSSAGGFATAVVATFLAPTRMLTFSNAGHPIPLIYTAKEGRWRFLKIEASHESATGGPSDLPLGIFEDGTYAELEVTLEAGDMILFYTDAFIESQAPTGELLGLDAFLNVVSELGSVNPDTLLEQIVERVVALYQGNLTNDDVTLLLFRPTGKDERVPLKKRLAAPFRLARGILQSLLNGGRGIPLPEVSWENLGLTSMKAAPKK